MVNLNRLNNYENCVIDSNISTNSDCTNYMEKQKCHKCGGNTYTGVPAKKSKFTKNKVFIVCEDYKELIGYGDSKSKKLYLLPKVNHDFQDDVGRLMKEKNGVLNGSVDV